MTKKPQIDEMMAESIRSEKSFQREIEIIRPEAKALRAYFLWVGSIEEEICGILVLTDITQIKKLENLRREFVANVSHELRTPLTSIRGFIETLLHGALEDPETGKRFLKMVDEDARRLERLIGDLMEISKLEAKQTPLHKERLSLETETAHAAESLRPLLTEKKISLHNHLEGKKLPQVFADSDKLQQILVNLLDNAIKFNKTGGEIHIEAEEEAGFVKVLVKDTGMGIPAEAVGRLFERFYRVDKARSREVGGTGLGLSIVKHLAEAHGGIAGCESEPGAGSTFFFTIPAA